MWRKVAGSNPQIRSAVRGMVDQPAPQDPDTEIDTDIGESDSSARPAQASPWPWDGEPTKADKWCWGAVMGISVYLLATLPFKALILSFSTYALAAFSGSNIAMIDIGARMRIGHEPYWWLGLLAAALTSIKFDWVFWWAGKLWGLKVIAMFTGPSKWAQRMAKVAERWAKRFGGAAIFLSWFVPFIPNVIVYAFVGLTGMRLRIFLLIDFIGAVLYRSIFLYLGYQIGAPAKVVIDKIASYSWYITIALIVLVVVKSMTASRKTAAKSAKSAPPRPQP